MGAVIHSDEFKEEAIKQVLEGGHPVYELFMKDSPAIERAASKLEVREKLERKVLAAIDEALGEGAPKA